MTPPYESTPDATISRFDPQHGLHLVGSPEDSVKAPSRSSDLIYQLAAVAAALILLATIV